MSTLIDTNLSPQTLEAVRWLELLDRADARLRLRSAAKLWGGLALAAVTAIVTAWVIHRFAPARNNWSGSFGNLLIVVSAVLSPVFAIAGVCPRESREQSAQRMLEGHDSPSGVDEMAGWLLARRAMLTVFQAGCLTADGIRGWRLRHRLDNVDRHQAAAAVALLAQSPLGTPVGVLLRFGVTPAEARRTLAYLVLLGWVDRPGKTQEIWLRRHIHQRR